MLINGLILQGLLHQTGDVESPCQEPDMWIQAGLFQKCLTLTDLSYNNATGTDPHKMPGSVRTWRIIKSSATFSYGILGHSWAAEELQENGPTQPFFQWCGLPESCDSIFGWTSSHTSVTGVGINSMFLVYLYTIQLYAINRNRL